MKKFLLAFVVSLSIGLSACKEETEPLASVNGPWELVKLEEARGGTPITGSDIGFTEKYEFFPGGRFSKTSTRIATPTGVQIKSTGVFSVIPNTSEEQLLNLRLIFESKPELVTNCNSTTEERLFVNTDYQLINDSWLRCDGQIFFYERILTR